MFKSVKFLIRYSYQGIQNSIEFDNNFSNNAFQSVVFLETMDCYQRLKLSIIPNDKMEIIELKACVKYRYNNNDRVFVNGYQSWTDSREFFINERIKGISKLAKPIMKKYQFDKYGDYSFKKYSGKKGEFHGYTYSYIRNQQTCKLFGSITERNGFTCFEHNIKKNLITIRKDCSGLNIDSIYEALDILLAEGNEEYVFDQYFHLMKIKEPSHKPMTGWTSWYNYYQDISEAIIIENLENFKLLEKPIDIFQIDDGYQTAVGDWLSVDRTKFPGGMEYISKKIRASGYKAGIWLAPFVCEKNSRIFKEKNEWILKNCDGTPMFGGSNWSGFYALDFYNSEVREYIKDVFDKVLNHWNYDMVKLDFLYAVCIVPRKDKTRGQIMTEAMEFLRECVGDKLILGCGVPLGPSFGLVDYCRIGCDVSLDWDDKAYMKLFHRERVSTLNAIRNSIGRRQLNGKAFINDPDVFLLRQENLFMSQQQKETLAYVNKIFGGLIFTSDNIKKYDQSMRNIFNDVMNLKAKAINNVEIYENGLVEVLYTEENSNYLALINLGKTQIECMNNFSNSSKIAKTLKPCQMEIIAVEK